MSVGEENSSQGNSIPSSRPYRRSLVILRRDLRIDDHQALAHACQLSESVQLLFVFDRAILDALPDRADRRVEFIWESLRSLESGAALAGSLITVHAHAQDALPELVKALAVEAVFFNHDDDPYALCRDGHLTQALRAMQIGCFSYKDHVVFERSEILTQASKPYSVFTPYKQSWLKRLAAQQEAIAEAKVDQRRLGRPIGQRIRQPAVAGHAGYDRHGAGAPRQHAGQHRRERRVAADHVDVSRKSTRLNSSHRT